VGKSLKEALLEQLDTLRERGLAPNEVPVEEEAGGVFVDARVSGAGEARGRPSRRPRVKGPASRPPAPRAFAGPAPSERNGMSRRDSERDEDEEQRRDRRPRPRGGPRQFPEPQPPMGPPRMGGVPGPRPGPGMGPMGGGPGMGPGPHQPGRSQLLQQRAEQRRRDTEQRQDVVAALAAIRGEEVDEEGVSAFLKDLSVETGALPPLNVVVEALRAANSVDVRAVGDQVRAYYRRPRRTETSAPPPPAPEPEPVAEPV
jgi:hypothetical protein